MMKARRKSVRREKREKQKIEELMLDVLRTTAPLPVTIRHDATPLPEPPQEGK